MTPRLILAYVCYWLGDILDRPVGWVNSWSCRYRDGEGHWSLNWVIHVFYPLSSWFLFKSCDLDTGHRIWRFDTETPRESV